MLSSRISLLRRRATPLVGIASRSLSTKVPNSVKEKPPKGKEQGAYFDFIEHWSRDAFYKTGYGLTAGAFGLTVGLGICQETVLVDCLGRW
jgi:hypothetical protein